MKYKYFVSYYGKSQDGSGVFDHSVVDISKPIECEDNIVRISKAIQRESDLETSATILYYKLMKMVDEQ